MVFTSAYVVIGMDVSLVILAEKYKHMQNKLEIYHVPRKILISKENVTFHFGCFQQDNCKI